MNPTQIHRTAPAWLYELAMARTDYEELLGWPVALHVTSRRLTIPAGQLFDAVSMPAALGELVQRRLQITRLEGPVIAESRTGCLTFLTGLSASTEPVLPVDLDHAGVTLVARDDPVMLPAACVRSDAGDVRWFSPPRPRRVLPAWSIVIGASSRVVSSQDFDGLSLSNWWAA
jgi:hypothetical protein